MDIYGKKEIDLVIGKRCDICGKENIYSIGDFVPIGVYFSYGSDLDGTKYDFCSYKCLIKFVINELRKQPQGENNETAS